METIIYICTFIITIGWSVSLYIMWGDKAGFPEDSGGRFFLILAPGAYFLIIIMSGWQNVGYLRLDLIGLIILDALTILLAIILFILIKVHAFSSRKGYLLIVVIYNIIAVVIAGGVHLLRNIPSLLISLTFYIEQWGKIDFFSFSWISSSQDGQEENFVQMMNKIFIALLSYIPVTILRFAAARRHRIKVQKEISILRTRIEHLENVEVSITDSSSNPPSA